MKLVVITGCLGFIGSYVTKKCLDRGYRVFGIDKCTYAANEQLLPEFFQNQNFSFSRADIRDIQWIPDCDYVINTAAETHVGNSIIDSTCFMKTNIDGVKNILDLLKEKAGNICEKPVFFHFSTDEVYGDIANGAHVETDLLNPSNPYSASKAAADMLIKAWSRTYGINYIILRPTNNYGTYQHVEKLIPLSVKLLQWNKKIRLHDQGKPVRNWLHADDTAAAVLAIMDSERKNEIFNVAGGFEQPNSDTVRKIITSYFGEKVNWEQYVDLGYVREGQDIRYSLNDDKLQKLGWTPRKTFDTEIDSIVQYYKNNFFW